MEVVVVNPLGQGVPMGRPAATMVRDSVVPGDGGGVVGDFGDVPHVVIAALEEGGMTRGMERGGSRDVAEVVAPEVRSREENGDGEGSSLGEARREQAKTQEGLEPLPRWQRVPAGVDAGGGARGGHLADASVGGEVAGADAGDESVLGGRREA